jgi:signal transduction histidine kinase
MNLTRHAGAPCIDSVWLQDCSQLLKDSIRSVHEISLLLRPTILDDFGLDSGLNWLCDRFADRSGIQVEYSSTFKGRLNDESETHLFRIAQEALTNVARHSGASLVKIELRKDSDRVVLSITDNGKGLPSGGEIRKDALGLNGMRARAKSSKGELTIHSRPEQGVAIQVWVPGEAKKDEAKDTYLVG